MQISAINAVYKRNVNFSSNGRNNNQPQNTQQTNSTNPQNNGNTSNKKLNAYRAAAGILALTTIAGGIGSCVNNNDDKNQTPTPTPPAIVQQGSSITAEELEKILKELNITVTNNNYNYNNNCDCDADCDCGCHKDAEATPSPSPSTPNNNNNVNNNPSKPDNQGSTPATQKPTTPATTAPAVPTVTKSEYDTLWGKIEDQREIADYWRIQTGYAHSLYNRMNEVPDERYTLEGLGVTKTQYGKVMALFPEKGDYGNYKYSLKEGVAIGISHPKDRADGKVLKSDYDKATEEYNRLLGITDYWRDQAGYAKSIYDRMKSAGNEPDTLKGIGISKPTYSSLLNTLFPNKGDYPNYKYSIK